MRVCEVVRDVALVLSSLVDLYRDRQYGAEREGERDERGEHHAEVRDEDGAKVEPHSPP